jgi:hypothetical protein
MGKLKHGYCSKGVSPEWESWHQMMQRCYNPNKDGFARYGGRGIVVCDRWQEPANFLADIGTKPSPEHTLERKNNDGNYEPENCEWATPKQQARNRSTSKLTLAEAREIRMLYRRGYTQDELAEEFGICQSGISFIVNNKTWRE